MWRLMMTSPDLSRDSIYIAVTHFLDVPLINVKLIWQDHWISLLSLLLLSFINVSSDWSFAIRRVFWPGVTTISVIYVPVCRCPNKRLHLECWRESPKGQASRSPQYSNVTLRLKRYVWDHPYPPHIFPSRVQVKNNPIYWDPQLWELKF